jgi:hypothetical protein
MKQYLVILFLSLISLEGIGQINNESYFVAKWTSGEYDQNDSIVKAGIRRGGPVTLVLNADNSAYYSTGLNCGFGSKMSGTWSYQSDTISLHFSAIEPYNVHPDFNSEPRTLKFKVKYLTRNGLILIRNSGTEEMFCKI